MSNVKIDRETFLVYLSMHISVFDYLVQKFEEIYQTDVERFYLKAIRSKGYRHCLLNDGSILYDYKLKRIYGVLLAADEDDILRNTVENVLYNFDKSFEKFVKKPKRETLRTIFETYDKSNSDKTRKNAGFYIPVYLAINEHGTDADIDEFQSILQEGLSKDINDRESNRGKLLQVTLQKIPNSYAITNMNDKAWKICRRLKNGDDLMSAILVAEYLLTGKNGEWIGEGISSELLRYIKSRDEEKDAFYRMSIVLASFIHIAKYFDFSLFSLLSDISLNKEEQLVIAKSLAYSLYSSQNIESVSWSISLNEYITSTVFYMLMKSIKQTKQYFEDNNNETIFSQIQYYREEKERQDDELKRLKKELQEEREKNDILRQQIQTQGTGTTTDTKPFMEEIASLNRKVKELQDELDAEREKTDELNRLREFVFDIKSEYIPENDETDLKGLIKGKKIVIIGGHINWRNKLKNKYPAIITMDGHNAASDFSPLSDADLVLLNTFNMSHKVYYKVIEILRKGIAKYDYIGRSTNQELYEKEIADIIKKHIS